MSSPHYVIIGNGIAGLSATEEARSCNPDAKITLVGNEGVQTYYRASLTEWITGELNDQNLAVRTPDFYISMAINHVTGTVLEVHPEDKTLIFSNGKQLSYTTLCIATGGKPNKILYEGLDKNLILTYRTIADAETIRSALSNDKQVLIVGGGVLGLELAAGFYRLGIKKVSLIENNKQIARPIMDEFLSPWLESRIREDGFDLYLQDSIDHVEGKTAYLSSGQVLHFDLLIQTVGITPIFPEVSGLEVGRGIRIDPDGQTNLPDIYACGDCTETFNQANGRWQTTRIWYDCARQGRAAGASMAGMKKPYLKKAFFNCSTIYREPYSYIGDPHGDGDIYRFDNDSTHRKIRLVEDKLAGAVLVNDRRGTIPIFDCIGKEVCGFGEALAHPDFEWNALSGYDWDYRFY